MNRELADFSDAPEHYEHKKSSDWLGAAALVLLIGVLVILAALAQSYGA